MAYHDYGVIYADKEYLQFEKRVKKVYEEAEKDILHTMDVFLSKYQKKNAKWLKDIEDGKASEDDYKRWMKGQVFQGQQWANKKASIAKTMLNANIAALNMANSRTPYIFQVNGNYAAYQMENSKGVNFGFNLYNQSAVNELLRGANVLPFKKLDKGKDLKWNFQNIKNIMAKSIIKGDGINKIANNLAKEMPNRNKNMIKTHARTMYTSAQNKGRMARFKEAEEKGIDMEKEWFATLDARTRDYHRDLDRQRKPLDEPFEIAGIQIMEPADPYAPPFMVYNCRCTMNSYIKKYPPQYTTRRDNESKKLISDMSYREWEKWKEGQG